MLDFLLSSTVQAILMTIVLAIICILGVVVVARFRNFNDEDQLTPSQMLTNFEELRDQGDINESEFRKLKTVLSDKLRREISDAGETG